MNTHSYFATIQDWLSRSGFDLSENALFFVLSLTSLALGFFAGERYRHFRDRYKQASLAKKYEMQRASDQAFFDDQLDRMNHVFGDLAQQALSANNQTFLTLAQQQFSQLTQNASSEFKLNHRGIENIIAPIKETLKQTETRLQQFDSLRQSSESRLSEQIKQLLGSHHQLQSETRNLVSALRRPEVRGQWGELTLKRLVELAGMSQYCDFSEQPSVRNELELMRPDMVITLPSKRQIVVDVKTPLDAYLSAVESDDPNKQKQLLDKHASNVRKRVSELAKKQYWQEFAQAADFVLLFIPGDQFLSAALENDKSLLEYSLAQRVLLATPTSLIGLLKTVAHSWQNYTLSENTQEIRTVGDALLKRLSILEQHLEKLGRHLDQSMEQFQRLNGSYNRSLKPAARRLSELGIGEARDEQSPDTSDSNDNL